MYAISPPFLPLHRLLYYICLSSAVLYPTPPPLIKGALAYSLTQSSIYALYSIIMALPRPSPVTSTQNLDVLPVWAMLSLAAITLPAFLNWNRNMARSKALRPIVRIWGVLITLGTACAFINLRIYSRLLKPASSPKSEYPPYLTNDLSQCQALPQSKRVMRPQSHVRTLDPFFLTHRNNFTRIWDVTPYLTFIPLAIGALACIVSIAPPPTSKKRSTAPEVASTSDPILEESNEANLFKGLSIYLRIRKILVALTPAVWITSLVLNELFLLQDLDGPLKLPVTEELYEVGQWGVWAGLGVVVLAGIVNEAVRDRKVKVVMYDGGEAEYGGVGRVV